SARLLRPSRGAPERASALALAATTKPRPGEACFKGRWRGHGVEDRASGSMETHRTRDADEVSLRRLGRRWRRRAPTPWGAGAWRTGARHGWLRRTPHIQFLRRNVVPPGRRCALRPSRKP